MDTLCIAIRNLLTDKDISLTARAAVNELWLTPNDIRAWLVDDPSANCQVQVVEEINVNTYPNYADVTAMVVVTTDSSEGEYLTRFTVANQDLFNALMDAA